MQISVTTKNLTEILREAKRQFISIAVSNRAGKWSEQYFTIEAIKDVKADAQRITMLVLHSERDSQCAVIDARSVVAIKFNKYLNVNETLVDEIEINSKEEKVLQHAG